MDVTFGLLFLLAMGGSCAYWLYRKIRDRINPPVDYSPSTVTFADAARLAHRIARDRVMAEAQTVQFVLPRHPDGTLGPPERPLDTGATTVDIKTRLGQRPRHAAGDLSGAA